MSPQVHKHWMRLLPMHGHAPNVNTKKEHKSTPAGSSGDTTDWFHMCHRHLPTAIKEAVFRPAMVEYITTSKGRVGSRSCLYYGRLGSTSPSRLKIKGEQRTIVKLEFDLFATMKKRGKYEKINDGRCPHCGKFNEDFDHILRCPHAHGPGTSPELDAYDGAFP